MFAGVLHRGGACARGGSSIDAQLLPCLSAAVTAVEGKSSTTSSGVSSRQSLGVGSQWAAHPLRGGGMCASTAERGLRTRGPSGRVLRATVRQLGLWQRDVVHVSTRQTVGAYAGIPVWTLGLALRAFGAAWCGCF